LSQNAVFLRWLLIKAVLDLLLEKQIKQLKFIKKTKTLLKKRIQSIGSPTSLRGEDIKTYEMVLSLIAFYYFIKSLFSYFRLQIKMKKLFLIIT